MLDAKIALCWTYLLFIDLTVQVDLMSMHHTIMHYLSGRIVQSVPGPESSFFRTPTYILYYI